VGAAEAAEVRAEELLEAHLTLRERAEYTSTGRITLVKRGLVWGVLLRDLAKVIPILALMAVPGWRTAGLVVAATVVVIFMPLWLPRIALASASRREWVISARTSPVVRVRGRTIRFCVSFREYLPAADRVLAWKHLVEHSESHFLRTANVRS
jgi:hypothetical protein